MDLPVLSASVGAAAWTNTQKKKVRDEDLEHLPENKLIIMIMMMIPLICFCSLSLSLLVISPLSVCLFTRIVSAAINRVERGE